MSGNAYIVDCDADPFVPDRLFVERHRKDGTLDLTIAKLGLFDARGDDRVPIEARELQKLLENERVLNANVLDHLLANPHLIPEDWKGKRIHFWGTTYRGGPFGNSLYVRWLYWLDGQWHWSCTHLDNGWFEGVPAAVVES